jgi:hypothetical protein
LASVRLELPFTVNPITSFPATVKPRVITLAASVFGATQMTLRLRARLRRGERPAAALTTGLDGARHLVSYSAETGIVW